MFAKPANFVIFPVRGFFGVAKVVVVRDGDLAEIQARGATRRERFDLAVEVAVGSAWGEQEDLAALQAPADWARGAAALGIAA